MNADQNKAQAQINYGSFCSGVEVASSENIQRSQTSIPKSSMSTPSYKNNIIFIKRHSLIKF